MISAIPPLLQVLSPFSVMIFPWRLKMENAKHVMLRMVRYLTFCFSGLVRAFLLKMALSGRRQVIPRRMRVRRSAVSASDTCGRFSGATLAV